MNINNLNINDTIKQKYKLEGFKVISNITEAETCARWAIINQTGNFILDKPYLLSIFMAALKYVQNEITLINCNSTDDRLLSDLYNADNANRLCVYYNVKYCQNTDVINKIISKSCIMCL